LGPELAAELEWPGFFPAGGGRMRLAIEPAPLTPLRLEERGALRSVTAEAQVAGLPRSIAERELAAAAAALGRPLDAGEVHEWPAGCGPGNDSAACRLRCGARVSPLRQRGVSAKRPAAGLGRNVTRVGRRRRIHLADQLLLPLRWRGRLPTVREQAFSPASG
jgi:RNA 3'-terminal phosphate cyclase (ATP)